MLPVMFKNSWFPTVFDDFFNTDFMPRANTTAPAVNVKEDENAYTMELAAPGIKKESCRVSIDEDGNLRIAIVSSPIPTTSRAIRCLRMWRRRKSLPRWTTAS